MNNKAVIEQLIARRGVGLVATHDLQLAELEKQHPGYVRNFYFDIQVVNGEMLFDYKLKPGECKTFNASLLLAPLVRFLPPDDERIRATVLAIADELTEDGLVLRYRVEETDDGLSGKEGTFTICSFWLVSALVEIGELERAKQLCERLLGFASPLKLYAEEIDPKTGRHLGNFPQALTHLSLISAAVWLDRSLTGRHTDPDNVQFQNIEDIDDYFSRT